MGGWTADTPMDVKQGKLSLNRINLLFQHLPVDISYVDENELVAFYSDTKHRVFPRSKGVIGRDVKNCHPKNSVHIVEEIIEKFRSGERDQAEFWINKPGVFIYIKYVAVREEDGTFRGVMEMMQDCTGIRSPEASQTLLKRRLELKEELPKINPAFNMLKSPIAKIIIPIATVQMLSERSGMEINALIKALKEKMQ